MPDLVKDDLLCLQEFSTPTLSNAIEVFKVRPHNSGYMNSSVRCLQPMLRPMVGHAVTGRIRSAEPATPAQASLVYDFWDWLVGIPEPRVVVLQDLDDPPGTGSFWGEMMATSHLTLGCVGTVTNGGVRDLPEVRALGFQYFAAHVLVSHAYVHMVDFGRQVVVGGTIVEPGQLLHADEHGVLLIPHQIAPYLAEVAQAFEEVEQDFLRRVHAPGFSPDRLKTERQRFHERRSALKPPDGFRA
jgi:4-hydroxy-4-methyl-2-oxoglutarate aldolase